MTNKLQFLLASPYRLKHLKKISSHDFIPKLDSFASTFDVNSFRRILHCLLNMGENFSK